MEISTVYNVKCYICVIFVFNKDDNIYIRRRNEHCLLQSDGTLCIQNLSKHLKNKNDNIHKNEVQQIR